MKITFKLFATLTDYLPLAARRANLIEPFGLPPRLVHLVMVNGHYIQPAERLTRTLVDGDVLAIWPPIAGG